MAFANDFSTSLSFSVRLPGGRVTFRCVARRKSPKRRPPREHVLRTSMCSGSARGRRGSPTALPCAGGELAHLLCAILRTYRSPARRVRGAPFGALPVRVLGRSKGFDLALNEAMDGRQQSKAFLAPLHDAAARSRSREQGADVRAQGRASSRRRAIGEHQGQSSRHDVGETVMLGAMVLATFAETKVARAAGAARNQDMDVVYRALRLPPTTRDPMDVAAHRARRTAP